MRAIWLVTTLVAASGCAAGGAKESTAPEQTSAGRVKRQPETAAGASKEAPSLTAEEGKKTGATVEAPEPARTAEEVQRCPDPYDGYGYGWREGAPPTPDEVQTMNQRHGLKCEDRASGAGCTDERGRVVIPFVYETSGRGAAVSVRFAESGIALVLDRKDGWVYIDVKNHRIGKALTLDGIPDEVFGGYARFEAPTGKVGFLDRERRIAIPAQYDAAFPFQRCQARVCVGCHPERWSKFAPDEALCTGQAFVIDESGTRVDERSIDWEECQQDNPPSEK